MVFKKTYKKFESTLNKIFYIVILKIKNKKMSGEIEWYCCKYCKVLIDSQYKENYKHLKKDKTDFNVICKNCIKYYKENKKKKKNDDIHLELFTIGQHMFINDKLLEKNQKYKQVEILKDTDPKTRIYIKCLNCHTELKSHRNQLYTHLRHHTKRKTHVVNNS